MKKKRIIPLLLYKDGWLVQSRKFSEFRKLGNAQAAVKRFSEWDSDELIYLDISINENFSTNRRDTAAVDYENLEELIREVAKVARMPITNGGNIKTLYDIETRLKAGADKVSINRTALSDPSMISRASREFGRQCIVVSVDYIENGDQRLIYLDKTCEINLDNNNALDWLHKIEDLGAGEILLNSVTRDGMQIGYDLKFLEMASAEISIPVIACGGAGSWEHLREVLTQTNIDAVAAANLFHFQDQSVYRAREYLFSKGLPVRPPTLQEKTANVHM